ncbi:4'-phosphopantetheinyl transferase superfamily protein [Pseudorhodobacter sp. E13]|uniref:4'-phosphopantetheinyl transferase superfamily protein n=1 Tax=Pseudorhodobacter sp. E13 TaxID=2487931 RepID=UPI001F2DEA6A|nr:4'-phosphopantetheinyl transferase superfamily protein [Pseudorhodobacter sp. E13]
MTNLPALLAAARRLAPAGIAWAVADPTAPAPPLWPGEDIGKAVPARAMEFAAGRAAAREALAALGAPLAAIPHGPDRAPVWPQGISGSLTHSASACLAAVTPVPRLIGIDLEPNTPLAPDLWETVLLPAEQANLLSSPSPGLLAKHIFSAKEAAYKAQYQRSQTLFDFHALEVTFRETTFTAGFTQSVPGFAKDAQLHGHICEAQGHILALAIA